MIYCRDIFGAGFPENRAGYPNRPGSLLALEIFFGNPIDFGFSTTFIKDSPTPERKLSYDEIRDLIIEAKTLGVSKIVFSGEEAVSCIYIKDAISFSSSLDIETIILKDDYYILANSGNNIPPFCNRHMFSCVVTSYGYLLPCPGLRIPLGNILNQKLSDILKDSEILCDLKDSANKIKGPCRHCENTGICCGCRGRAYLATGDYLASDLVCINIKTGKHEHETVSLPLPADQIIPQKPPMRIIDTLDRLAERSASCSVLIKKDMPFIEDDGSVDNVAYLEMIAQSIAALNGFRQMNESGSSPEGYLLGAKNLSITGRAEVGDRLSIMVFKYARYGGFGIVKGIVSKNSEIIARGEIKVWHKTDESE
ncbi:Radical SAM domain protein [sediment metagenome]|uniref:Radical SAM domain protein n=1 Tax=sediment metagenome TaxID=749907 RepID=D9PNL1_9ZZZZ